MFSLLAATGSSQTLFRSTYTVNRSIDGPLSLEEQVLMSKPNSEDWYHRLPSSEQATIDSLRDDGFHVSNRFT